MVHSRADILRAIISSTEEHFDFTSEASTSNLDASTSNIDIPPLRLSTAAARFASQLSQHDIPPKAADAALSRVSQLTDLYMASYSRSCAKLLRIGSIADGPAAIDNIVKLRITLENLFEQRDLPAFMERALKAQTASTASTSKHAAQPLTPIGGRARKPFNLQFKPYLEAYLEQNAFPSSADQKSLAEKGGMDREQIITWFQNHRSRARKEGKESDLKRLPPGQMVNVELIEEKIKQFSEPSADMNDDSYLQAVSLDLDQLASSSLESVPKAYQTQTAQTCVTESEAFHLPNPSRPRSGGLPRPASQADDLDSLFGAINIRAATVQSSESVKANTTKSKATSSRASTPKTTSTSRRLKASLRSCFSAAITLTCPRVHPALIRQKKHHATTPLSASRSTVLEQKREPVQPYTPPAVLPSWELPAPASPEPTRRKKPTIPSHGGKSRPGSPYPKQTLSRVSSSSSLASMASDDSQSSSRSVSSTFSTATIESQELGTPAQSPSINPIELVDDPRFADDIFGDYLYNSTSFPDFSSFDLNVEEPFEKDVSLSFAEFDQSISLSIPDFDSTNVPSFGFFES